MCFNTYSFIEREIFIVLFFVSIYRFLIPILVSLSPCFAEIRGRKKKEKRE